MTKHHLKPHGLALFLFLVKAGSAAPAPSQYNVTGALSYNGVYQEVREPELHYKKLGGADNLGLDSFLYKGSQHGDTWIIGFGKTLSVARAHYRAPAVEGRPPVDQWGFVVDGSREGREKGNPKPEIKVVGVETKMETELESEPETNNCFAPQPILKSISLAILVLTVINI